MGIPLKRADEPAVASRRRAHPDGLGPAAWPSREALIRRSDDRRRP
jgi:hypothetical protein